MLFLTYSNLLIQTLDVNECTTTTHDCHTNADCINTSGGFICACKSGYDGDGKSCRGIKRT